MIRQLPFYLFSYHMNLFFMPDHGDFKRARSAVISTSVILFFISRMDMRSNSIDFFGLIIGISKPEVIFYWRIGVVYLFFVFCGRVVQDFQDFSVNSALMRAEFKKQTNSRRSPIMDQSISAMSMNKVLFDLFIPPCFVIISVTTSFVWVK